MGGRVGRISDLSRLGALRSTRSPSRSRKAHLDENDGGTRLGESERHCLADASRRARDDGSLAAEAEQLLEVAGRVGHGKLWSSEVFEGELAVDDE